jgi:hypothetical protein
MCSSQQGRRLDFGPFQEPFVRNNHNHRNRGRSQSLHVSHRATEDDSIIRSSGVEGDLRFSPQGDSFPNLPDRAFRSLRNPDVFPGFLQHHGSSSHNPRLKLHRSRFCGRRRNWLRGRVGCCHRWLRWESRLRLGRWHLGRRSRLRP